MIIFFKISNIDISGQKDYNIIMTQNYQIIKDNDRFDIIPTETSHDNETIFDSFRNCKKQITKLIYIEITKLEKKIKLREDDLNSIRKIHIKDFLDNEEL